MRKISSIIIIGFGIAALASLYFFLTDQISLKALLFNAAICTIGIVAQVFTMRRRKKNTMY